MNFEDLVEARTTSLQKLKKTNAIDVASEYPEEFVRILFNEIEKLGFKLKGESKKKILDKIRESITDVFHGGNPLLNTNNHLKFEVETESGEEIDFDMYIEGNEFNWRINAGRFYRQASGKTNLRNKSVVVAFEDLLQRLETAMTAPDLYRASDKETEEFMKKVRGKPSKPAEIISRIAKHFGMRGGQEGERSSRGVQIFLRPSSEMIGIPRGIATEVEKQFSHSDYTNFKYTYQLDQLQKAFKVLVQRLEANNYLITDLGFGGNDYLYLYVDQYNPNRINQRFRGNKTYQEVHDLLKEEQFKRYMESMKDKAEYATKEHAQRDFIEKTFERLG